MRHTNPDGALRQRTQTRPEPTRPTMTRTTTRAAFVGGLAGIAAFTTLTLAADRRDRPRVEVYHVPDAAQEGAA